MVVDALIFIAQNIFGLFYIVGYIISSIGKVLLLVFKPLWFIFYFVVSFIQTLFNTPASVPIWTPDPNAVAFLQNIPGYQIFISGVSMIILIIVTVKAFKYGK